MTLTLPECIDQGLAGNPRIRAADFEIKKAISEIGSQRGNFFPTLSTQTYAQQIQSINSEGPVDQDYIDQDIGVFDIRLSQTLFQGFTILNGYQKSILNKQLAQATKEQTEMELVLEIQTNFLELLKAKEDVRSLRSAVERLRINVQSANAYFNENMAPYLSVLQSEVDLADAIQQLTQVENEVKVQNLILNTLLGIPAETAVDYHGQLRFESPDSEVKLADCIAYAYANRPEMKIAKMSLQMATKDQKIKLGQLSPKIIASADYFFRDNDYRNTEMLVTGDLYDRDQKNSYWTAMVQLQWEFNLGGQQLYQHSKATYEIDRLRQNWKDRKDRITAQVKMNFLELQEAGGRVGLTQTALLAAEESYQRAQKRSQVKMLAISDLLDIQGKLTRAEVNRNQAIADYYLGIANLSYSMGLRNYDLTLSQILNPSATNDITDHKNTKINKEITKTDQNN